jgi:DNA-binding NarL/FixJ family response regulator
VANLVKEVKTTNKIAALTNSSARAVEFHRQNLRKKLGLKSYNSNVRSHVFLSHDRSLMLLLSCGFFDVYPAGQVRYNSK